MRSIKPVLVFLITLAILFGIGWVVIAYVSSSSELESLSSFSQPGSSIGLTLFRFTLYMAIYFSWYPALEFAKEKANVSYTKVLYLKSRRNDLILFLIIYEVVFAQNIISQFMRYFHGS